MGSFQTMCKNKIIKFVCCMYLQKYYRIPMLFYFKYVNHFPFLYQYPNKFI